MKLALVIAMMLCSVAVNTNGQVASQGSSLALDSKPAPAINFLFRFSSRFPDKKGEGKFRVVVRAPDGTEIKSKHYSVAHPPSKIQLSSPLPISGIYEIITEVTQFTHTFGTLYYNVAVSNTVNSHIYYSTLLVVPTGVGRTVNANPIAFP